MIDIRQSFEIEIKGAFPNAVPIPLHLRPPHDHKLLRVCNRGQRSLATAALLR